MKNIKTRQEVREELNRIGCSVAEWARERKVTQALVYQVLNGKKKGLRGESHRIAVLLGIKDGIARTPKATAKRAAR